MSFRTAVTGVVVALGVLALTGIGLAARVTPNVARGTFVVASPAPVSVEAAPADAAAGDGLAGRQSPGAADVAAEAVNELVTELPEPPAEPTLEPPVPPGARAADRWVAATSSTTGIPARAVQAYGDATVALASEDPACRLGWNTLAGIGLIESGHGRAGLQDDGHPAAPIVGPALDGSPGRAAIRATAESSAWHGDPTWDHAVGPLQFIPSTWYRWGADGDGDGVADPQDIDDAALAAARYLCAGARDLTTTDGWWAAVLSYNHSEAYAQKVLAAANSYAVAAE